MAKVLYNSTRFSVSIALPASCSLCQARFRIAQGKGYQEVARVCSASKVGSLETEKIYLGSCYPKNCGSLGMAVRIVENLFFGRAKLLKTVGDGLKHSPFAQQFPKSRFFY